MIGESGMKPTVHIKKLADLAYLSLEESEQAALLRDLEEILTFADALTEYPLEGETEDGRQGKSVLREDEPRSGICREELLAAASVRRGDYIAVPCVFGGEES